MLHKPTFFDAMNAWAITRTILRKYQAEMSLLVSALQEAESKLTDLDIGKALAKKVSTLSVSDLRAISRTLAGLFSVREDRDMTVDSVIDDVKETIESEKPQTFKIEKLPGLLANLKQLMTVGGEIGLVAKAKSVICTNERNYCGSKVLSDLRPVFLGAADKVTVVAIVHNLKISYHQEGDHKSFTVAMNPTDLQNLKRVLERAEGKAKAIRAYVEGTGIRYLEDTE